MVITCNPSMNERTIHIFPQKSIYSSHNKQP